MKHVAAACLFGLALVSGRPARAGGPVEAGGGEGVCVLSSGDDYRQISDEVRRSLGPRTLRVDVHGASDLARIARQCGRLMVALGRDALRLATSVPGSTPVVFAMVSSPGALLDGKRPVSGVSLDADPVRVMALLRRVAPAVRRLGVVYNPRLTGDLVSAAAAAARAQGMELVALPASSIGDAIKAFHRFEREIPIDALWLVPDATATAQETVRYALEMADWKRIAVVGLSRWYVTQGALFALAPHTSGQGELASRLALDILRGGSPQGVRFAGDYTLLFNTRAARRLGLKAPRDVLDQAEEVSP